MPGSSSVGLDLSNWRCVACVGARKGGRGGSAGMTAGHRLTYCSCDWGYTPCDTGWNACYVNDLQIPGASNSNNGQEVYLQGVVSWSKPFL